LRKVKTRERDSHQLLKEGNQTNIIFQNISFYKLDRDRSEVILTFQKKGGRFHVIKFHLYLYSQEKRKA
jgi:hypothetical protein